MSQPPIIRPRRRRLSYGLPVDLYLSRTAKRVGTIAVAMAAAVLSIERAVADPPSFTGLGFLPGGNHSQAFSISGDGSVVSGFSFTPCCDEAFRWTRSGGMVGLGIPAGGTDNYATDLSSNGSTIVGFWDDSAGNEKAFHWTSTDGIVGIGSLPNQAHSEARAVSGDGLTIAGTGYWNAKAFRWTQSSGFLELGNLPGGNASTANDISSDGLTIVGEGYFAGGGSHPFRWTSSDGMVDLISSGFQGGAANAASADGSVIVGTAYMGFNAHRAFRWTQATGLVDLGYIVGFGDHSASSVSADGSVIVGSGDLGEGVFYWTQAGGIRKLRDVLINDYGLNLSGWSLRSAGADKGPSISADGMTIVGTGTDPQGRTEAWIAHLPEPTTALLLTAGLLFRRRSSGGMGAWSYYLESNNRTAT